MFEKEKNFGTFYLIVNTHIEFRKIILKYIGIYEIFFLFLRLSYFIFIFNYIISKKVKFNFPNL